MSNFLVALAVFIITVIGALFTVPYFIDWNGYRGVFEEEASRFLNREVRVGGAVYLHLLPTPYFRFEKVRIADASALDEPFFRAESVTVKVSVPPLLRGAIEANEIEFQRPVLRVAPNDKGGWNWQSLVQVLSEAPYMPTNVALTSLKIKNGVLAVHGADGTERTRIEGLDGELSSPELSGPYRFRGTYTTGGAEREVRLATAKAEADGTVRFKALLRLVDVGSVYNLDGRLVDLMGKARLDGELTARLPVSSIWQTATKAGGSTHAKGVTEEAKPAQSGEVAFELKAMVAADAAGANLTDVALSFEQDGRPQLLTGEVKAGWREALSVDIKLASRWLDLDRLAGTAEGSSPFESIIPLAVRLRDLLPGEGRSRASFIIDQANIAREAVSDLTLSLVRSQDRLEVEELRLGMPGGSRGELQGIVSGPVNAAVFEGNLGLRGVSVVRFLGWARGSPLSPDTKGDGSFGLRARLAIAPSKMELKDIVADLSGTALYGAGSYRWEGRPEITLAIEGPQIDARPFVPEGTSLQDLFALLHASPSVQASKTGWRGMQADALIRINAGLLMTAGRTYRDVALEMDLRGGYLRLPLLRLSGEEGYSLELEGEVQDVTGRSKGSLRALAVADAASGILPLAELLGVPDALRPTERRLQQMVPLRLAGSVMFGARTPTSADILFDGEAGTASVKATARLDGGPAGWRKGLADMTGSIEGPEAGKIVAALLGTGGDSAGPGRILVKAGGTPADGLATLATIEAGELSLGFRGQLTSVEAGNKIAGDLDIKGADASRLAAVAGLSPPLRLEALPVAGTVKFAADAGAINLERLALNIGGNEVKGKLALSPAGERRRIAGHLMVGELTLARLLAPVLDQRLAIAGAVENLLAGQPTLWPDEPFDPFVLEGFEGTLKLEAGHLALGSGLGLNGAVFDLAFAPGKIEVKEMTGEGLGGRFGAAFAIEKRPGGAKLTGTATFDALLEALAPAATGGTPRAVGSIKGELEFSGQGTSPRNVMAALQGKGSVELGDAKLGMLWPGAVSTAIPVALKQETDKIGPTLRQRLAAALSEGQLALGPGQLGLDIVDGQIKSKPLIVDGDQDRATGNVTLDLRSLAFDSEWRLERKRGGDKIDEKAALPAVIVSYRGSAVALSALEMRLNTEALERELTTRKMELELEELERLRKVDEAKRRTELERLQREQELKQQPGVRPVTPGAPILPKSEAQPTPG